MEKECNTLHEKLDRSTFALTAVEKKVTDLSVEVAKEKKLNVDQATELTLLREELDMTVAGLREELVDDANRYIWQTKARLIKQYWRG